MNKQCFLKKVINRIKFELVSTFLFIIYELEFKIINSKNQKINVLTEEETINQIIEKKMSISRFGDGELKWILQVPQESFQTESKELSFRLQEVLTCKEDNLLICIPGTFGSLKGYAFKSKRFWRIYTKQNINHWLRFLDENCIYGDSLITRPYIRFKNKEKSIDKFNNLRQIWDKKAITIIEGDKSYLGVGNDLFVNASSIKRIICPSVNAFDVYEDIYNAAKILNKNELILIALGPTATILSYDLTKIGFQVIDIGHIDIEYEWFLKKATKKIAIKGKYVNETGEKWDNNFDLYSSDESYKKSIIKTINI